MAGQEAQQTGRVDGFREHQRGEDVRVEEKPGEKNSDGCDTRQEEPAVGHRQRGEDEDVEQAAEDVNLADFIRALPKGFDEEVRERGSTLSTGQKQLISFARALAHEPKILILDEATSSVDTETEFRVRDALSRMVEGRTSLIIAHRLSTVQRADKIIVMHKGQVREMGTHQQLLAQRGIYFKLYQLQYKDQELTVGTPQAPESIVSADD